MPTRITVAKWKYALIHPDSGLTMREVCTALVLAVHMDKTGETWVSLNTLARETRQSKKTVQKYVDSLEAKEWCIRVRQGLGRSAYTFASIPEVVPPEETALGDGGGSLSDPSGSLLPKSGSPRGNPNSITPENSKGKFQKEIPGDDFFEELNNKWSEG